MLLRIIYEGKTTCQKIQNEKYRLIKGWKKYYRTLDDPVEFEEINFPEFLLEN